MKVDIPYKFGQSIYLKNDIEQVENFLYRIILEPKGRIVFEVMNPTGDYFEVPESFILTEKDILKALDVDKKPDENDEE